MLLPIFGQCIGTMDVDFKSVLSELAVCFGVALLAVAIVYVCFCTRRISRTEDLPKKCSGMKLSGIVTSVPDGDGFRFFHTPWLRSGKYKQKDNKLPIRLAGIDAPEMQGNIPGQPFAKESKEYLTNLIWKKKVDIKIVGKDRYNRVLAFAYLPGWFFDTNVNFQMVKKGLACVYIGQGAEYDGQNKQLAKLEEEAKRKKIGMWKFKNTVTPMEHKRIHRTAQNTQSRGEPPSAFSRLWNFMFRK